MIPHRRITHHSPPIPENLSPLKSHTITRSRLSFFPSPSVIILSHVCMLTPSVSPSLSWLITTTRAKFLFLLPLRFVRSSWLRESFLFLGGSLHVPLCLKLVVFNGRGLLIPSVCVGFDVEEALTCRFVRLKTYLSARSRLNPSVVSVFYSIYEEYSAFDTQTRTGGSARFASDELRYGIRPIYGGGEFKVTFHGIDSFSWHIWQLWANYLGICGYGSE